MGPERSQPKETPEKEILIRLKRWVEGNFPKDNPHREVELEYFRQAEEFAQQLNSKADPLLGITVFSRAVERTFPPAELTYTPREYYEQLKELRSSRDSLKLIRAFLRQNGASNQFIDIVVNLNRGPEEHSLGRVSSIRCGFRIAFLRILAPLFIPWVPSELSADEIVELIGLMYYGIPAEEAREVAKPYYLQARAQLEEASHRALADYWREVAFINSRWMVTPKDLAILREAREHALAFVLPGKREGRKGVS